MSKRRRHSEPFGFLDVETLRAHRELELLCQAAHSPSLRTRRAVSRRIAKLASTDRDWRPAA